MNTFICYPKCSTCKKALNFLKENNINYDLRDIKLNNPNKEELDKLIKLSGKDIKHFFNTSGLLYRSLGLKDKIPNMSYDEKLELLASDGMLVKRPIFVTNDDALVGFKENEWIKLIK